MKLEDFTIGIEFTTALGDRRWRCTDVGSRTVIAIALGEYDLDPSWYDGPPYAVVEHVFAAECGMLECCEKVRRFAEKRSLNT